MKKTEGDRLIVKKKYVFFATALFMTLFSFSQASASEVYDYKQGFTDLHRDKISSIESRLIDNDIIKGFVPWDGASIRLFPDILMTIQAVYFNIPSNGQVAINFYDSKDEIMIDKKILISGKSGDNYITEFEPVAGVSRINIENITDRSLMEIEIFGDIFVYDEVAPSNITNVKNVFNEDNSVTYQYDFPTDSDFSHLKIYQDGLLLNDNYKLNTITITDLQPEKPYNFKFVSVDSSGNESDGYISSVVSPSGPDLIPPLEVSEIKKVVSGTSIQFSYKLPIDDDFSHLQVWRNNVMIADNLKINTFNDNDLDYETTYNYVFKSVDFSGNVSNGSSLAVQTMPEVDEIAPLSPVGVDVVNGNASLFLSWSASPENDVVGYNVYVDGVKRNGSPVAGNSFRMTNLVNGQEYSLQVSAVDTSGNESELTQTFVGVPDSAMLPVFKVDTDLSAVAKSTENWFSQLWLVTAFSASIPIAFFVGGRVKALFFA